MTISGKCLKVNADKRHVILSLSLVEVEEGVSQEELVAPFVVTFQDVVNKGDNAEPGIFY